MQKNDLKLLEQLKQGHSSAFKDLFDLYYIPLSSYALKYCNSFDLAEDVVQDLFVKIWDDKLYLKFENAISPYLFKAVKNNSILAVKQKNKYYFEDIEEQVNNLIFDTEFEIVSMTTEKQKLQKEIEALPEKSKKVFEAIVLQNLKYKEVADLFGISVNTVKTHYSRALKQLRSSLSIIVLLLLQ
ncbi:RNA polymerase sigma factor [Aestuariibaculum lutulentum]|uniref:RNA polymerase sigma-70 factor n=1 Tax=Aestuariibaculum lutulentum TaxID=2920935 RepID=A0ABS9RHT2_9FLAO|nr:RNA polymerase sigma-70 factor [Aestuariibaculum lutulentum]MCH4551682.1 RNA polymerase sigma-70 factor [Aestuariibaculum lutulentum]